MLVSYLVLLASVSCNVAIDNVKNDSNEDNDSDTTIITTSTAIATTTSTTITTASTDETDYDKKEITVWRSRTQCVVLQNSRYW